MPILISLAVSCRRDETLDIRNTEYISFKLSDGGIIASGEVTKGACDTLSYEISDWDYVSDESDSETKASLTTTLSGQSGIFGYNFSDWSSGVKPEEEMYNMKGTFDGDELTPSTKVLWKKYTSGSLRFYAYSPYGKFTLSGKEDTGTPYLTYTVPTDNSKQIDILYAQSEDITSDNRSAVPLQFKHAMTAVQFRLGIDGATLKNVTVTGVNDSGKLFLDGTWSYLTGSASYSVANSDSLMIMIPQTVPSGATVSLTYNDGSADQTIKASIAGQVWEAGKKVVYTLKKKTTGVEYIYFDLYCGDIIITDATYSGYICVNGKDSLVSGTHLPTNKYYIYHSASATYTGTNESIKYKNTGYATVADFQNRANIKPRIPQYSPVIVGGKTWKEYITNNTKPEEVLASWSSIDENITTFNRILITGNSTFDVTLDRVYNRYFPYLKDTESATTYHSITITSESVEKYGGITIGAPNLISYNKKDWGRTYEEKVTLRLKGNNYFSRISYSKPVSSKAGGYLKITSEKGDGIAEGTLTVTLPKFRSPLYNSTTYLNFSRCALIGGGNSDGDYMINREVSDLEFNGGIVYVGLEEIRKSKWNSNTNLMTCIGAVNSKAEITINGGVLTSVAYGPGSAIGGGAGWDNVGGEGIVTIKGGTVYAYCFGVYNSKSEKPVKGTAIGGGSSGNKEGKKGTVVIKGGNVYAYSRGGVAIGGGTSSVVKGGDADITVSGGHLYAKSFSGKIGDYTVETGTAIGGGGAGITNGDGGSAKVTITGGIIESGSVGGGSCDNTSGKIGRAVVSLSGGETSAQFLLVKDKSAATANTFTMTGGTIKNSSTSDTEYQKVQSNGGAVYMESGTCSIKKDGIISGCSGTLGGAIYMNGGTFNMSGGTIKSCKASTDGGGVYIEGGDVNISNKGTIDHNIASKGDGGGVCIRGGNFTMTGGNITNNSADADPVTLKEGNGGGIYVSSKTDTVTVSITGGNVQYNASDRNGGGLCVDMSDAKAGVTANIVIGTVGGVASTPDISANSAALSGGGMAVEGEGSRITINSGTVKGNVSAYVKNEDIRNDGGIVDLVGKGSEVNVNYKTIRFYANNGSDPEPSDDQRVITSTNSILRPTATALAFKKDFYHLDGWNTKRDGTGTPYPLDGGNATMNITEDVALYGQWVRN